MLRRILQASLIIFLIPGLLASETEGKKEDKKEPAKITGYQDFKWGITKNDAIKILKKRKIQFKERVDEDLDEVTYIGYADKILSKEVWVWLLFFKDQFFWAQVSFEEVALSDAFRLKYFSLFEELDEILTKKYGKPKKRVRSPKNYELGIFSGKGAYFTIWEDDIGEILLRLTRKESDSLIIQVEIIIMYTNKKLYKEYDKYRKQKTIDEKL